MWQKIAIGACGLLTVVILAWTDGIAEDVERGKAERRDLQENDRMLALGLKQILGKLDDLDRKIPAGRHKIFLPPLLSEDEERVEIMGRNGG